MIDLISLSAFVIMWLCRFSMRCKRCTAWTTSNVSVSFKVRRPNVEPSRLNLWRSFNHNPWQWRTTTVFVRCDLLRQLQFRGNHLPRRAKQTFPVRRFPSVTHCLFFLPCTTPFLVIHKTAPVQSIMMTNKNSLSHELTHELAPSAPIERNQTFLSKLRHWLSPSSTSSPQFTRLSIFANPHVVHDLRCKTKKPTE